MQRTAKRWTTVPLQRDSRFDTYFHTLSHDLRTPLTQITGFAELLNLDQNLAVDQREYTAAILSLQRTHQQRPRLIENSLLSASAGKGAS